MIKKRTLMKTYIQLICLIGSLTLYLSAQSSYLCCKDGWSLEIRKGKDICYKYDKTLAKRYKTDTQAPKDNNRWRLIVDDEGYRDRWKKVNPQN